MKIRGIGSSKSLIAALLFVGFAFVGFSYVGFALETNVAFATTEDLKIVPNEKVCMVTNMLFSKTQIPVVKSGKTYYGCCEMCKKTLSEDAQSRAAVDPVTGKPVDKAVAVIAARDDGSVLYFESRKTFESFAGRTKKKSPN